MTYEKDEVVHDILSIGFGPAGLAVAVAVYEKRLMSFVALEQQDDFKWHPGMLIPGAHMQISFLKDLATLRDPKSEFTFLNYLFEHGRLLKFLNLDTFLPAREEYQDYMHWAAKKIDSTGCVKYNTSVKAFEPTQDPKVLRVIAEGPHGEATYLARNVIVCTGGQPNIPESFPSHPHLHHSSGFLDVLSTIKPVHEMAHGFCVIGSGQSAAEIWSHLSKVYPATKVNLKFRSSALKPSDDSPFVNEIFDPATRIDQWYEMSPASRKALISESRATNYSVVRLTLLEQMYQHLYAQELPGHEKVHTLSPNTIIESWTTDSDDSITIHHRDATTDQVSSETFDHVFCATGYTRTFHKEILSKFEDVKWNEAVDQPASDRLYRVQRTDGDNKAGIYLQGLCESSHGLSDTLLSVLSTRGMEVVEDIARRDSLAPMQSTTSLKFDQLDLDDRKPLVSATGSDYGSEQESNGTC